jgi:hypothetical protein
VRVKRQDEKRVGEVHVYYGQINPIKDLDDKRNFRSRSVTPVSEDLYGTAPIKEVFSRWIPQFGRQSAERCGERLIAMFRDAPHEATFTLHASRDGQLELARYFALETPEIQDALGAKRTMTMAPVEIDRGETTIAVRAQQVTFQTLTVAGVRTITIENDSFNLNLRDVHDSIYTAPIGDEVIEFIVLSGVTVGSTSTGTPAIRTGSWPAGVTLTISIQAGARVEGKGGMGGGGGNNTVNGQPGLSGGLALLLEHEIAVTESGEIWAGGGGGGGGGPGFGTGSGTTGGGGGGGGCGTDGGAGGNGGDVVGAGLDGSPGQPGTADAGGTGGGTVGGGAGNGGAGGGPALTGSAGQAGNAGSGGAGGGPGNAIDGVSLASSISGTLDIRGAQIN